MVLHIPSEVSFAVVHVRAVLSPLMSSHMGLSNLPLKRQAACVLAARSLLPAAALLSLAALTGTDMCRLRQHTAEKRSAKYSASNNKSAVLQMLLCKSDKRAN